MLSLLFWTHLTQSDAAKNFLGFLKYSVVSWAYFWPLKQNLSFWSKNCACQLTN